MADEVSGVACDRVATGVRVVMVENGSGRRRFAVYRGFGLLSGDYFVDRKWIPGNRFGRQKKKTMIMTSVVVLVEMAKVRKYLVCRSGSRYAHGRLDCPVADR